MKIQPSRVLLYILLLASLVFTTGCGGSSFQQISGQQNSYSPLPPDSLTINAGSTNLAVGTQTTLTARLTLRDGEVREVSDLVTWSSSTPTVAPAPEKDGVLTALTKGQTQVQATLGDLSSNSLTITVSDPSAASLRIENGDALRAPGSTIGYRAIATLSDGSELDVTSLATWASDKTEVSVDDSGLATVSENAAIGTEGTVSAVYQGQQDEVTLTVNQYLFSANQHSNTVSQWRVNPVTGELSSRQDTATGVLPSILTLSANSLFLYVTNQDDNTMSAFKINPADDSLTPLAGSPFATGTTPVGIAVDPQGRFLAVANGGDDTVSLFSVSALSGLPTPLTTLGPDEGVGVGPFALVFHPDHNTLYVANPGDNTLSAFNYSEAGVFSRLAAPVATGDNPGAIGIHPSGDFLYASNFADHEISGYKIASDGTLAELDDSPYTAGQYPQFQGFHPSGSFAYVASVTDKTLSTYDVGTDGALTVTSTVAVTEGARGIVVTSSGRFLYAALSVADQVTAFAINAANGALSPTVPNSPYASGDIPFGLVLTP